MLVILITRIPFYSFIDYKVATTYMLTYIPFALILLVNKMQQGQSEAGIRITMRMKTEQEVLRLIAERNVCFIHQLKTKSDFLNWDHDYSSPLVRQLLVKRNQILSYHMTLSM